MTDATHLDTAIDDNGDESIANAGRWDTLTPALSSPIRHALTALEFDQMTPVQATTVPLFMSHKDVIVEAVTGSGKTLAFVIPVVELVLRRMRSSSRALRKNEVGAVIISPTRELAKQIYDVLTVFVNAVADHGIVPQGDDDNGDGDDKNSVVDGEDAVMKQKITHMLFIGGNDVHEDVQRFSQQGAHILVGTPGRLDDLLKRQTLFDCRELEVLVMDEADRLLDMGFEQALTSILRKLPKQRRTGLFSATMNEALDALVKTGLRNPVRVTVRVEALNESAGETDQRTPTSLDIGYTTAQPDERLAALVRLFHAPSAISTKFIVYFSTCACVDYYYKVLPQLDGCKLMQFHSLHGKMDPKRREAVYTRFAQAPPGSALLCTDIAARGLDIPDVDWVIQFDPPQDPKAFAHRCGRTARLGRRGRALVFLAPHEDTYVEFLRLRKVPIEQIEMSDLVSETAGIAEYNTETDPSNGSTLATSSLIKSLQSLALADRDVYEKSIKAYVSWVRAYSEHQANYIFHLKQADLGAAARSFGLLRLPRMPELKNIQVSFTPAVFDPDAIRFRDKQREKQRQANAKIAKAKEQALDLSTESAEKPTKHDGKKGGSQGKQRTQSWSHAKEARERRLERKDKRERRRVAKVSAKTKPSDVADTLKPSDIATDPKNDKKRKPAKESQHSDMSGNDDFVDDYTALRKERRRKRGHAVADSTSVLMD